MYGPKNFLFVSADAALITDIAWHVHGEGHSVRYYIEAERDRGIGDGFVPKTDDWRGEVAWTFLGRGNATRPSESAKRPAGER